MLWPLRGHLDLLIRPVLWWRILNGQHGGEYHLYCRCLGGAMVVLALVMQGLDLNLLRAMVLVLGGFAVLAVPFLKGKAGPLVMKPFLESLDAMMKPNGAWRSFCLLFRTCTGDSGGS